MHQQARRPRINSKINNFRGPIFQVNFKSKPAVNQIRDNKFFRKTNLTASVEREAVGEFVANWNTEMKEISISVQQHYSDRVELIPIFLVVIYFLLKFYSICALFLYSSGY